jgi:Mg-chelatase subunit ChlD
VSLENIVLQSPDSDRGPKIFTDQRHAFTANLQEYVIRVAPTDPTRPMRCTLVWTDAPADAGDNPALQNDLDLEVSELATGTLYRGNVNFANGFSAPAGPGDAADDLNNVECVYIQNPSGTYEIRVVAGILRRNGRPPYDLATLWQDFALIIDNAEMPSAAPVSVVPVIDRSGSMVTSGYVDITRTSSKQFVDLMNIDDQLGVVSFGDSGDVEYPLGPTPALETITDQPTRDDANNEIDAIGFGGCTYMGQGIERARDQLNLAAGSRAMVLLSDGYDNKGCNELDPTRPWARDVAAGLPANMPVYTCAMGPVSDQGLLADIADDSGGRYYYMPTIDDLFEIYNYIRGQVTGDAIIVNESAMASGSSVGAFVDALATEATFSIAWPDTRVRFVTDEPKGSHQVRIQLRDPNNHLLHANTSYLQRIEGAGYVIFKLREPMPGQWYVEVTTDRRTHLRYTVGGFVRSALRLVLPVLPRRVVSGMPIRISAQVFDGRRQIRGFTAKAHVTAPYLSIPGLLRKYSNRLRDIQLPPALSKDGVPDDLAKLGILRNQLLKDKELDIFAPLSGGLSLRTATIDHLNRAGLGRILLDNVLPVDLGAVVASTLNLAAVDTLRAAVHPTTSTVAPLAGLSSVSSGVLLGQFKDTAQQGSYNMVVTASGMSPVSNTRFVRKQMVSVLVK